eukprot:gnl/Dysnectes_brevis/3832_a4943_408.p1 GENE.gnl/Dysnectes_brevis/3832_a4943_408~~gnl/Dysnectes_brevis/3832_a4943_408.p1  ORF type:complete len:413 (-),score=141.01 gnl/Dysnectes_brevis/3832_a4943_408:111-1349(-)
MSSFSSEPDNTQESFEQLSSVSSEYDVFQHIDEIQEYIQEQSKVAHHSTHLSQLSAIKTRLMNLISTISDIESRVVVQSPLIELNQYASGSTDSQVFSPSELKSVARQMAMLASEKDTAPPAPRPPPLRTRPSYVAQETRELRDQAAYALELTYKHYATHNPSALVQLSHSRTDLGPPKRRAEGLTRRQFRRLLLDGGAMGWVISSGDADVAFTKAEVRGVLPMARFFDALVDLGRCRAQRTREKPINVIVELVSSLMMRCPRAEDEEEEQDPLEDIAADFVSSSPAWRVGLRRVPGREEPALLRPFRRLFGSLKKSRHPDEREDMVLGSGLFQLSRKAGVGGLVRKAEVIRILGITSDRRDRTDALGLSPEAFIRAAYLLAHLAYSRPPYDEVLKDDMSRFQRLIANLLSS